MTSLLVGTGLLLSSFRVYDGYGPPSTNWRAIAGITLIPTGIVVTFTGLAVGTRSSVCREGGTLVTDAR